MTIERLNHEEYKGKKILFRYWTSYYFDIEIDKKDQEETFKLIRKPFKTPQVKQFEDTLLEDWLENPQLFGAVENDELIGYLELSHESWNNRMRVSNIWVEEGHRGKGIGKKLMEVAEKATLQEKARALILETQSCNYKAICFYKACGLSVIGFDLFAYTNDDVGEKEFRIEMGKVLKR